MRIASIILAHPPFRKILRLRAQVLASSERSRLRPIRAMAQDLENNRYHFIFVVGLITLVLSCSTLAAESFSSNCIQISGDEPLFAEQSCKNCIGSYCTKDGQPLPDNFCRSPGVYWTGKIVCAYGVSTIAETDSAYNEATAKALFSVYDSLGMLDVSGNLRASKQVIKTIDTSAGVRFTTFLQSYNQIIERRGNGALQIPYHTLDSGVMPNGAYFVRIVTGEEIILKSRHLLESISR